MKTDYWIQKLEKIISYSSRASILLILVFYKPFEKLIRPIDRLIAKIVYRQTGVKLEAYEKDD